MNNPAPGGFALGVFAKAPIPGHAKTRLAPLLGAAGAARLQAQLIEQTLTTACAAAPGAVTLFSDGDAGNGHWSGCIERHGVRLLPQQGADLGARMLRALQHLLTTRPAALLIGSDCPALTPEVLHAAAAALHRVRMVFVPAEDGGYVLVGAREPCAAVFKDMPWGSDAVMCETRQRLQSAGWQADRDYGELPTLWDLDTPADYARACADGGLSSRFGEFPT